MSWKGPNTLVGSDHRCCTAVFQDGHKRTTRRFSRYANQQTRCGKWRVDLRATPDLCVALDEQLRVSDLTFDEHCLEGLARQACRRPGSLRYRDSQEIKSLIAQCRQSSGAEARTIARHVVTARAQAKKAWLTELLERGAQGDFHAVSFFKRRQSTKSCARGLHDESRWRGQSRPGP